MPRVGNLHGEGSGCERMRAYKEAEVSSQTYMRTEEAWSLREEGKATPFTVAAGRGRTVAVLLDLSSEEALAAARTERRLTAAASATPAERTLIARACAAAKALGENELEL